MGARLIHLATVLRVIVIRRESDGFRDVRPGFGGLDYHAQHEILGNLHPSNWQ